MSEELHKAIGRLEAIAENSEKVSGRLFKKMDEVTANVAALTIAHNSVAGDVDEIGKDITDTILPQIEDYKSKKAKALGYTLRSEEHTSELQSHHDLVCRLLLEQKNKKKK